MAVTEWSIALAYSEALAIVREAALMHFASWAYCRRLRPALFGSGHSSRLPLKPRRSVGAFYDPEIDLFVMAVTAVEAIVRAYHSHKSLKVIRRS